MYHTVCYYLGFYQKYALQAWDRMEPVDYGVLLIAIAAVGYILMKSSGR